MNTRNTKKISPFKILSIIFVIALIVGIFYYATQGSNAKEISITQIATMLDPNGDKDYSDSEIQALIAQDNVVIILKKESDIKEKDFNAGKKYDYYATYSNSQDLTEIREKAIEANNTNNLNNF